MPNRTKNERSLIFAKILSAVFVGEVIVMLFVDQLPFGFGDFESAVVDAVMLSFIVTMVLWATLAQPLQRLAEAEGAKFNMLIEAVPDGVIGVDSDGIIRIANERVGILFDYRRDDLIGKPIELLVPDRFADAHAGFRQAFMLDPKSGLMARGKNLTGRRRDGNEIPIEVSLNAVDTGSGLIVLSSIRDVTDQRRAQTDLVDANTRLSQGMQSLERSSEELRRLSELGELLQGCITESEAHAIIERLMARLLPDATGGVYALAASRNGLQLKASWGAEADTLATSFSIDDCWALRRGRMHTARDNQSTIQCRHINPLHDGYLCLPIMAQGDLIGIFHIFVPLDESRREAGGVAGALEQKKMLLVAVSEQIGLAVANLRLREELTQLSIRDPLTGLFNRRFMEESFERELLRQSGEQGEMALVMIDLDHFKKFNDTFGHEGGDLVLREAGEVLRQSCGTSGVACRLGGEELALLLPGLGVEEAAARAEEARRRIEELAIVLGGKPLGKVTASFGIACFPQHGNSYEDIVHASDLALYRAKSDGRNRVVIATAKDELQVVAQ